jgi:uncharacterized membrane protein HdeD (DUF308 family)
MGAFFLVAGLFQLITPFVVSPRTWGWHALNGLITLVLNGGAWIALALDLRSLR